MIEALPLAAALLAVVLSAALLHSKQKRVRRLLSWLVHGVLKVPPRVVRESRRREAERLREQERRLQELLAGADSKSVEECEACGADSLARFAAVSRQSQCSFARAAVVRAGPSPLASESQSDSARRALPYLARFCAEGERQRLDGFLLEVAGAPGAFDDVAAWGRAVLRVLSVLAEADPAQTCTLDPRRVEHRGWIFRFMGEEIFVTTFAPCYGSDHARFPFEATALPDGRSAGYVLLQPEWSFEQHNIGPDHPFDAQKTTQRQRIRERFAEAGRPYLVPAGQFYARGPFVVPPLEVDGPVVRWWDP